MTDIATITAFLGSIKTAADLAKSISGADITLEKAELKLRIAELLEAIASAKIQALEVQELLQEKDLMIKDLREKIEGTQQLVRDRGKYYEPGEDGKPIGDPYCSHCWEANSKKIHMDKFGSMHRCPACDSVVVR